MRLQSVRPWARYVVPLVGLAALLLGCASSSPTIGKWNGPSAAGPRPDVSPWQYQGAPGWELKTPHYAIYTTIAKQDVREMLPGVMEGAYAQYRQLAPDVPVSDRPMDCYVFFDRGQWNEFTRANTGRDSVVYLQIRRGGYAIGDRYVSYYIGPRPTASVAAHEGWHQFVARNFKGRLPPFLEEGLATTFEGVDFKEGLPRWNPAINPLRAQALRRALDEKINLWPTDQLIRLHAGEVVKHSGEQIEAFYAQCWAFAKFMREADNGRYAPALRRWLAETADGTVYDPSGSHKKAGLPWNPGAIQPMLEHYLNMPLPQIDQAFKAYMHKVAYDEYPAQWGLSNG